MNWLRWLLDRADEYAAESTWRDFALVKLCLCAVGILLGLLVPSRHKPKVAILAGIAFVATYIPLMADFIPYLLESKEEYYAQSARPQGRALFSFRQTVPAVLPAAPGT